MYKLKRCPCCKGEAQIMKLLRTHFDFYAVVCQQCGIKTTDMPTVEKAVAVWNLRKPVEDMVEQLEEYIENNEQNEGEYEKGVYNTCQYAIDLLQQD